jgi:hypothetical protein
VVWTYVHCDARWEGKSLIIQTKQIIPSINSNSFVLRIFLHLKHTWQNWRKLYRSDGASPPGLHGYTEVMGHLHPLDNTLPFILAARQALIHYVFFRFGIKSGRDIALPALAVPPSLVGRSSIPGRDIALPALAVPPSLVGPLPYQP